tara:strand:+ start:19667 stop:20698 length:1032 start_codon:yes stop_codon:yes gene_type:complete
MMLFTLLFLTTNQILSLIQPSGRFSHNSIYHNNKIWILGGSEKPPGYNRTCLEDGNGTIAPGLWKYNPRKNKWKHDKIKPPARRGSTLVKVGRELFLHGGGIVDKEMPLRSIPCADLWKYNKNNNWELLGSAPGLYCHSSVAGPDGKIYSFGGINDRGFNSDLFIYNGKGWRSVKGPFPNGIMGHTSSITEDGLMFIIGGVTGPPNKEENYNADVWTYNIHTEKWNLESGGLRLYGHTACTIPHTKLINEIEYYNEDIIIIGGYFPTFDVTNDEGATHLGGTVQNIYSFNTRKRTWKFLGRLKKPREFHSAITINNDRIFVYGGYHIGSFWEDGEIIQLPDTL